MVSEIAAAAAEAARSMNRYPDRDALDLRADLARYLGHRLTAEQIWAANGSNEVMLHVLQAFAGPGRTVLSFAPTYSMYPEYARDTNSDWITFPRRADFGIDPQDAVAAVVQTAPAVVLITSPNNPTGSAIGLETIGAICDVAPGVVVVDEAYYEFARAGTPSAWQLLPSYPRLAVSRTMSRRSPRRWSARLSGGGTGIRGRATNRPAAIPPLVTDPSGGAGCMANADEMLAAVAGCGRLGTIWPDGWLTRDWTWLSRTRISFCSAASPTGAPSGRRCSTAAC